MLVCGDGSLGVVVVAGEVAGGGCCVLLLLLLLVRLRAAALVVCGRGREGVGCCCWALSLLFGALWVMCVCGVVARFRC